MGSIFAEATAVVAGLTILVTVFFAGWGKGPKGAIISIAVLIAAAVLIAGL